MSISIYHRDNSKWRQTFSLENPIPVHTTKNQLTQSKTSLYTQNQFTLPKPVGRTQHHDCSNCILSKPGNSSWDNMRIPLLLGYSEYVRTMTLTANTVWVKARHGGIPRTSLNIPWLSWENLARQSRNSQSELNGTTKLTLDSISWNRFSALGSVRVHVKGAFFASFFSPLR